MAGELGNRGGASASVKHFYSPQAVADLRRLHDFIADKNPAAAARVSLDLRQGIARVRQFPHLGRRVWMAPGKEAPEEIRDLVVGNYVARYLILDDRVIVLRVWHSREDRG